MLRRVKVADLRCVAGADLSLDAERNYIYGPNGAGKTSLLEAIFLLGRGRSFRTRQIGRLVRRGASEMSVYGEVEDSTGRIRRVGVAFASGRLEKKIDTRPIAGSAALVELLPVHTIDPSSHELIEGAPSERRRYLDWGVFHVEHAYLADWRRYRRLLGQRNAALKAGAPAVELKAWTAQLAAAAEAVDTARAAHIRELAPEFAARSAALLGKALVLEYDRGWSREAPFDEALKAGERRDRVLGRTESGPHRADVGIVLDGRPLQQEASRGQQKLAAAALVLAQARVFERRLRPSVLLVNDPAAELDGAALERLLAELDGLAAQRVLTGLTPAQLPPRKGSAVFHVERGEVRAL